MKSAISLLKNTTLKEAPQNLITQAALENWTEFTALAETEFRQQFLEQHAWPHKLWYIGKHLGVPASELKDLDEESVSKANIAVQTSSDLKRRGGYIAQGGGAIATVAGIAFAIKPDKDALLPAGALIGLSLITAFVGAAIWGAGRSRLKEVKAELMQKAEAISLAP
jgi:hypothetical protein